MVIYKSTLPNVPLPDLDLYTFHFEPNKYNRFFSHDTPLFIDGHSGRSLTYTQVYDLSSRMARGWRDKVGLKKGDVVACFAPNQYDHIVLYMSLLGAQATITPGNPNYTEAEFLHQIRDSGAKALVTVPQLLPVLLKVCDQVGIPRHRIFVFGQQEHGGIASIYSLLTSQHLDVTQLKKINPREDLAFILYSSGTTGRAKGVMLTHRNFVSQIMTALGMEPSNLDPAVPPLEEGAQPPVAIGFLPFFHIYGLCSLVLNALYKMLPVVVMSKFNLELFCQLVEKYKITSASIVPPVAVQLAKNPIVRKYDLSSIQYIGCGAAPLNKEHLDGVTSRVPEVIMRQGYGMTETTSGVIMQTLENGVPGSIGIVCPNVEVKIIDENGQELGDDQEGELLLRGTSIMKGYLNNPKANADTFTPDGWMRTGDICKYDSKTQTFFITDRIKELIKYKGFQVAPAELEALLLTIPEIADACVIGVNNADEATEHPRAYVVLQRGIKQDDQLAQRIMDHISSQVASHKRLRGGIRFVPSIPKNSTGKILRRQVRNWAKEEEAAAASTHIKARL